MSFEPNLKWHFEKFTVLYHVNFSRPVGARWRLIFRYMVNNDHKNNPRNTNRLAVSRREIFSVSRTPLFEIKNSFKFEHERNFIIKHKKEVIPSE